MTSNNLIESIDSKPWFFWFIIFAGALFIIFGIFATVMIFKYNQLDRFGYTTSPGRSGVVVEKVDPAGPAAGKMQPGDRILAIDRDERFSRITMFFWRNSVFESDQLSILIDRNGSRRPVTLSTENYRASPEVIKFRWERILPYLPRYLCCLIVALMIGFLKPWDRHARLGSLAFLAIAHQAVSYTIIPIRASFSPFEDRITFVLISIYGAIWFGPVAYHASYRFFEAIPRTRFWTITQWSLYMIASVVFLNRIILTAGTQTSRAVEFRYNYYPVERVFGFIDNWYWMVCLLAISAVLIRNNIVVRDPDQRRRIRVILYGSLIGVLPQAIIGLLIRVTAIIAGRDIMTGNEIFETLRLIANLGVILIPLSWGYAILKRQVYEIDVVIRRSVQYLLAQNALRLFVVLPVLGVIYVVITKSDRSLKELAVYLLTEQPLYLLLLVVAVLSLAFRSRLQDWIDRRFFREAYQQDKILSELSDEVRKLDSMSEMSRMVSQKIEEALHPEHFYLFYRGEDKRDLSLDYSSRGRREDLLIPEEFQLLRQMEMHGKAVEFPFPAKIRLPQEEHDWLASIGTRLIVPMLGSDHRLSGLMLLGPKKSESPYTGRDGQLLDGLAGQIAIVYENVRLKERVARDRRIQYEVLSRVESRRINLLKECPACNLCYDSSDEICHQDRAQLRLSLPVERTIDGRYRLDKLLGRGGMGAVYEAADIRLNRNVAVKILGGGFFGNSDALRRFEREARASARLNHNHIVQVYDYGVLTTEGAYLVMELLRGQTLGQLLDQHGYLEPARAAEWFDQILSAMEAAHNAGIIHRDLKPDNIFLAEQPEQPPADRIVKILDFGVAKIMQRDGNSTETVHSTTTPGTVIGTFGFMSPEQWLGESVDHRSDIFSLGVMVVLAMTGTKPFNGKNYQELMTSVMSRPFRLDGNSLEALRLDAALQKCLAKDKTGRYSSVAEMRRELIPAIRQCTQLSRQRYISPDADTAATRKITSD